MLSPDHNTSKLGSKDFIFQVNKWPFSITCNPLLPSITETFIDLSLVKDMKIPLKKVECRKISYGGLETKLVGTISQTVQVVYDGVPSGTMHLKAKVIRHLTTMYGVDCIASKKLYKSLTSDSCSRESAEISLDEQLNTNISDSIDVKEDVEESLDTNASEESTGYSPDDLIFDGNDSPKTRNRKRRNKFTVANISFTSSMKSSPSSSPKRASIPADSRPARASTPTVKQVPNFPSNLKPLLSGNIMRENHQPAQERRDSPPPPPDHTTYLCDQIFCGHYPPCSCLPTLRNQQLHTLPPYYPIYLPSGHKPCGQVCGSLHVHGDNLHPPDPSLCPCNPPRLLPSLQRGQPFHAQAVRVLDEPPIPHDFQPCGDHCEFQSCECLRSYGGRDFAS